VDSPVPFTTRRGPGGLHMDELGAGPPIIFVHGAGGSGAEAWRAQWPLAERWRLIFTHRPGYGPSPLDGREDFEADAALIADLLGDGAHLVGHSYGGVVALLAAARRPRTVWSLLVIEPPFFSAARGDPDVEAVEQGLRALHAAPPANLNAYLAAFLRHVDVGVSVTKLPPADSAALAERLLHNTRHTWEAELPADVLMAATFPKLFLSGGHHPAFEAICDSLALQLGGDRKVLRGAGHFPPALEKFNGVLEAFVNARPLP
jgi:pimeloyl-ACP methyl ester carboxylesterase